MSVNIVTNTFVKSSFNICVKNVIQWLEHLSVSYTVSRLPSLDSKIKVFIGDMYEPYQYGFLKKFVDVWWVDTARYGTFDYSGFREVWVTSKFNYDMISKKPNVLRVVHRILSPLYFTSRYKNVKKDFDFITIATDPYRKRLDLFRDVCRRLNAKCIEISPLSGIKPFTVTEEEKIELIAKSKFLVFPSMVEGFGMPVVEANILSVPAIFTDGHALSEIGCGIPVKVKEVKIVNHVTGTFKFFVPDEDDIIEKALYAINMSKEEYEDISKKCYEKTVKEQLKHINFVIKHIMGYIK